MVWTHLGQSLDIFFLQKRGIHLLGGGCPSNVPNRIEGAGVYTVTRTPLQRVEELLDGVTDGIHEYGVMNYVTAFSDAKITKALITTFKYAFITVPLKLIFALFIAYILNFKIACVNLFRTVYYIPSILGGSVEIGRASCRERV